MNLSLILLNLILSFVASVGFGIITNIPKRALLPAGFTGAVVWIVYELICTLVTTSLVLPNLVAGLMIGLIAEFFKWRQHVSANVIAIPALVSLVPGSGAYKAMTNFVSHQSKTGDFGIQHVFITALAITMGFFIAEFFILLWRKSHRPKIINDISKIWSNIL